MKKIEVPLPSKPYNIYAGANLEKLPSMIKKEKLFKNVFCAVDEKVFRLHKERILNVSAQFENFLFFRLKAEENKKNLSSAENIYSKMLKGNFGRDTLVLAIGGGITGDVAGFAAATYMRGVQLVHVPTTLLAAVDSAIGGKTGVNFGGAKNIVGAFYQPEFVFIDEDFLSTLPDAEISAGLGEVLKYALITGGGFYNFIKKNKTAILAREPRAIKKIIFESASVKAGAVAKDEKESGLRKILNLGHTFAHAVEAERNYKIKHGEAVIIGLAAAAYLSKELNLTSERIKEETLNFIRPFSQKIKIDGFDLNKIFRTMFYDKKNRDGELRFVLFSEPGNVLIDVPASAKAIRRALSSALKLFYGGK
ncbi:MAG: 3-dehydroquinate synthase [Chlorobi bacterium]|nr:3-dehydroquinate synthase [Chlorobiota bacterium]